MAQATITAPVPASLVLQRVADYARLSEDDAKDPDLIGENVRIQLDECELFRLTRPDLHHVGSFKDNDISASAYGNEARPDFDNLMELVRGSGVDVILCVEVTRLFRKPLEAEVLIDLVWSKKTSFHTILTTRGGYYDLRTSAGRKAVRDAVNAAAGESDNISDRVRLKKGALARRGKPNGGRRAYGYAADGVTIVEHEAAIIREIAKRLIAGETVRAILADLNERGVPTAEGKKWYKPTLINMMKRKRYIGIREHKGAEYPAVWDAILSVEEFERVQAVFKSTAHLKELRGNPRKYLLGGYAFCGACGNKLGGSMKRDRPGEPNKPRYKCLPYDSTGRRVGCAGVSRLAEPLEDFITETVLHRFDSEDFAKAYADAADDGVALTALLDEHQAKKAKLASLIDDYYGDNPDNLSREQFMRAKSSAEASLARIERELEKETSKRSLAGIPIGMTLREAWERTTDLDWRRAIIGLVIDKVTVHPGGGKPRYKQWRFDINQIEISWIV